MIIFLLIMVTNLLAITEEEQDRYIRAVVSKDPRNVQPFIDSFGVNELLDTNNNTALHYAAQNDDARTVQFLIEKGALVNAVNGDGRTPLQEAERFKNYGMEKYLNGSNPLHWALYDNKKLNEIEELLKKNKDWLNSTDNNGNTPLHVAVKYSDIPIIKLLVTNGANLDAKNRFGRSPLDEARNYNLKNEVMIYFISNNPLQLAVYESDPYASIKVSSEIQKLVNERPDLINKKDKNGNTPLHTAAEKGLNLELSKFLIEHQADITAKNNAGFTPSEIAYKADKYFLAKVLATNNPLIWAIIEVPHNSNTVPPAIKTLINDHPELINVKDISGNTPLHYLTDSPNNELAKFLIIHGADITAKNNKNEMPYNRIKGLGFYGFEKILKTSNPLQWAIYSINIGDTNNIPQEVKKLVQENPELIKLKDIEGNTPLHTVAETNNIGLAKFLVENGADSMEKNNKGKTPYDLARSNDIRAMMNYLSPKLEPLVDTLNADLSLVNALA